MARSASCILESLEPRQLLSAGSQELVGANLHADAAAIQQAPAAHRVAPLKSAVAPMAKKAKRIAYKGPIVIKKGGVYSGNWQSLDANVPAVRIRTWQPVIIQNSNIRSRGSCIDVFGVRGNVTVKNTNGYGMNPNVAGKYPGRFLDVDGFVNIVAVNNYMQNTSGMYFYNYVGNHTPKQTVTVMRNIAVNIDGRQSDGLGGWANVAANPDQYKQFVQFNGLQGMAGVQVAWNQIINQPNQSRVEENINLFNTTGSPTSPILVHDNYILGAYPGNAVDALDYTGGGIMMSDQGSSYITAYNNQVVNTGGIGITITSGHDNHFVSNRIISSGLSPAGVLMPWSNVGGSIWNADSNPTFGNNTAYNNIVGWVDGSGNRNDLWQPDGMTGLGANTSLPDPITKATEAGEWTIWQQKLAAGKVKLGVVQPAVRKK